MPSLYEIVFLSTVEEGKTPSVCTTMAIANSLEQAISSSDKKAEKRFRDSILRVQLIASDFNTAAPAYLHDAVAENDPRAKEIQ